MSSCNCSESLWKSITPQYKLSTAKLTLMSHTIVSIFSKICTKLHNLLVNYGTRQIKLYWKVPLPVIDDHSNPNNNFPAIPCDISRLDEVTRIIWILQETNDRRKMGCEILRAAKDTPVVSSIFRQLYHSATFMEAVKMGQALLAWLKRDPPLNWDSKWLRPVWY